MKLLTTLAMALAVALPAKAADPFTTEQAVGLIALGAFTYRDYRQTLDIKNHSWAYETNPLLGRHPSDNRVRNYFAGMTMLGLSAVYVLPSRYRKYAIGAGLVLEVSVTENNKRLGFKGVF